jgi:hypothetical protein
MLVLEKRRFPKVNCICFVVRCKSWVRLRKFKNGILSSKVKMIFVLDYELDWRMVWALVWHMPYV